MGDFHRLALGTVQFGLDYGINNLNGKPSILEVEQILNLAIEKEVNILDTAIAYGDAEQIIGKFNNGRFEIVTKFLPETQNGALENQFKNSLNLLKTRSIYGLLAHRPMDVVRNPELWEKMKSLKESLKVKKIGFSFNDPKEYYAVIEKDFHPDLVQVPFNFLDNRFASIIDNLKINGCEIHARSVFLQGLFFSDTKILPSFFEEIKETICNLQVVHAQALPAGLLRYVLDNKQIDKVVIGVQNQEQLKLILESMDNAPVLAKHDIVIKENILQPSYWPKREW